MYTVIIIGGPADGHEIESFDTEYQAIRYAEKLQFPFHPVYGGTGIVDPDGNLIEF